MKVKVYWFTFGFVLALFLAYTASKVFSNEYDDYEAKMQSVSNRDLNKIVFLDEFEKLLGNREGSRNVLHREFLLRELDKQAGGRMSEEQILAHAILATVRAKKSEEVLNFGEGLKFEEIYERFESSSSTEGELIKKLQAFFEENRK